MFRHSNDWLSKDQEREIRLDESRPCFVDAREWNRSVDQIDVLTPVMKERGWGSGGEEGDHMNFLFCVQ